MKTIIIFNEETPNEKLVLKTDLMTLDYGTNFTVMTVEGAIDGVDHQYKGGTVTTLSEVAAFATELELVGVVLDIKERGEGEDLEEISPKFLSLSVTAAFNESSYKNAVSLGYLKTYSYEDSAPSLPWLIINYVKTLKNSKFKLEISKDGEDCELGGNFSEIGEVSEDKRSIDISDFTKLMISCKTDLGLENPNGEYTLKFTLGDVVDIRTVKVY